MSKIEDSLEIEIPLKVSIPMREIHLAVKREIARDKHNVQVKKVLSYKNMSLRKISKRVGLSHEQVRTIIKENENGQTK